MKCISTLTILATAMTLAACGQPGSTDDAQSIGRVVVTDAICRPTPNGRQVTGCYLSLISTTDDTLVSISSPVAALAQVHEMRMESNMMMMRELESGLPLPEDQIVTLAPGGNHIMLMGVTEPLKTGDTVPLTLTFATAAPVEVVATVGQPPAV